MWFKPTVRVLRHERELRWLGRLLLPGIFDGEHYFLLEPTGGSATHLTQGEIFTGLLAPFLDGALRTTEEGFKSMNAALKKRAEHADSAQEPHSAQF